MHTKKELFDSLISPLSFLLLLAGKAYDKYLQNKIFIHAETLRQANKRVYELVSGNTNFIPDDLKDDLLQLLNHYDIWFAQFRIHKKKQKPLPGDLFVFEQADNQCAFPRETEQHVFQYYIDLKKEIAAERLVPQ